MTTRQAQTTPERKFLTFHRDDRKAIPRSTGIYVLESWDGDIIWIGQSTNPLQRVVQHARAVYWPQVELIHILPASEDHKTRLREEAFLLQLLQPSQNRAGTNRDVRRSPLWGRICTLREALDAEAQAQVRRELIAYQPLHPVSGEPLASNDIGIPWRWINGDGRRRIRPTLGPVKDEA